MGGKLSNRTFTVRQIEGPPLSIKANSYRVGLAGELSFYEARWSLLATSERCVGTIAPGEWLSIAVQADDR